MSETTPPSADAEETYDRDALAEDARTLVKRIESIHPDPYLTYDGRVDLHASLERLVRNLPDRATAEEFYRRAAPLVAGLEDSHSALLPPDGPESTGESSDDPRLPVSFRVVGEQLFVDSVFDDSLADLLGARLLEVGGESVEQLVERSGQLFGVENRYGAAARAGRLVRKPRSLARLLDRSEPVCQPTIRVRSDGEERSLTPTPVTDKVEPTHELDESFPHPAGTGPRYRLYKGGEAAVFVPGDLQGYRESFEIMLDRGAEAADELVPAAYDRHVGGDPPESVEETVAALPSMSETLAELADEMAAAGTDTLIVDLRDNPGGDSQFVSHLAYVLRGWEGVARMLERTRSLKRRTDPHCERYGVPDDEGDALQTAEENPAGYDFSGFLDAEDDEDSIGRIRELLTQSETFADVVETGDHEAAYEPDQLVVAVSTGTMSSGFAGAAELTGLGADLVGVPSGQAPLSFGEAVEEPLPNTGLTVSIAGAMYHWVPDPDPNVLELDRELTSDLFDRYERTADAGLRLAFDDAGVTNADDRPPEPFDP